MNLNKNIKIMVWGTGKGSIQITEYIKKNFDIFKADIVGYVDNNREKWNTEFMGKLVIAPNMLDTIEFDYLEIASIKAPEIIKQCKEELNISPLKISCRGEAFRSMYTQWCYEKNYCKDISQKIVVYTANFGNYDILLDPLYRSNQIDYVCFTDNEIFQSDIWNVQYIKRKNENQILMARWHKIFPDKLFPQYDISIWVDSKFLITGNLSQYLAIYQKDKEILCFPHFSRNCIYDEAKECIRVGKAKGDILNSQTKAYRKDRFPENYGLYETGCLVRRHNESNVKEIMKLWWLEIEKRSTRDQVSFPYILWKYGYKPDICNLDIVNNPYLKFQGHIHDN